MTAQVYVPQGGGGIFSDVMKGLSVAETIFGIRTNKQKVAKDAENQAKAAKREEEKLAEEAFLKKGGLDAQKERELAGKGWKFTPPDEPGALQAFIRRNGVEQPIGLRPPQEQARVEESVQEYLAEDGKVRLGRWIKGKGLVAGPNDPLSSKQPEGAGTPGEREKMLSLEDKAVIGKLANQTADKINIRNSIQGQLDQMKVALEAEDEDLAVSIGNGMLKTLNSTEGADAVGVDEAKRLASFLEYKIANFTQPGSFIGRDLDKFVTQAESRIGSINQSIEDNRKEIARLKGNLQQSTENLAKQRGITIPKSGQAIAGPSDGGGDLEFSKADAIKELKRRGVIPND